MVMKHDGHRMRTVRSLSSTINVEILPEDDWKPILLHEVKRIQTALAAYQSQVKKADVYPILTTAIENLEYVVDALKEDDRFGI